MEGVVSDECDDPSELGGRANCTVRIEAHFEEIGRERWVRIATGEKRKGILGFFTDVRKWEKRWVATGVSDCRIDTKRLNEDLEEAILALNDQGYELLSIVPITSGEHTPIARFVGTGRPVGHAAYGFSYTSALLVTGRRRSIG